MVCQKERKGDHMEKSELQHILIFPDTTIKQAMQKLNETAKKILFVVDEENKMLGTLTDGDIRRALIYGSGLIECVKGILSEKYVSIPADTPDIQERVKSLMLEFTVEQVPVLDEQGRIVDVYLWTDFLDTGEHAQAKPLRDNPVVIMAGGIGTRLDPFTKILPKPLIPINNKPVIEHIMDAFYRCGLHKFIYTLNYKKEYIKLFLQENAFPYEVDWVEENDFLGTAGGLSLLKGKIHDTFFLTNCDVLMEVDYVDVLDWHRKQNAAMTLIGCHNEVRIPFGVLQLSDGRLREIVEKPVHDLIINAGVYVIEPRVIEYISDNTRLDINELIEVVMRKEKVSVYTISDGWFDIGRWEEYRKTVRMLGAELNEI